MSAVLYALRACAVATLEAVRVYVLEQQETVDMKGEQFYDDAYGYFVNTFEGTRDRKKAVRAVVDFTLASAPMAKALQEIIKEYRTHGPAGIDVMYQIAADALASRIVGDPGDKSHGPRCSCHICIGIRRANAEGPTQTDTDNQVSEHFINCASLLGGRKCDCNHPNRCGLPQDVIALVCAARRVAFEDQSPEAIKALDDASEAFADRVPWEDEPTPATQTEKDNG